MFLLHCSLEIRTLTIPVYYEMIEESSNYEFLQRNNKLKRAVSFFDATPRRSYLLKIKKIQKRKIQRIKQKFYNKFPGKHFGFDGFEWIMDSVLKYNKIYTKTEIENQAMVYEKLRQTMSTKEFVDQYNKLLDKPIEN